MATQLSQFFFTSEASQWLCPNFLEYECVPPAACAYNSTLARHYCCDVDGNGPGRSVCWAPDISCATDALTITCDGPEQYCCFAEIETCTRTPDQSHVCWLTALDVLGDADVNELNGTFSSLSSTNPSASSFPFTPNIALVSTFASSSSASSTPPFSNTTSTRSASLSSTNSTPPSAVITDPQASPTLSSQGSSLSAKAIAGIVIGTLITLALLTGAFYIGRRGRKTLKPENESPQEMSAVDAIYELSNISNNRLELPSEPKLHELPGDHFRVRGQK